MTLETIARLSDDPIVKLRRGETISSHFSGHLKCLTHLEAVMKIAVFVDVDRTITKDTIQEIYAKELGLTDQYKKIEEDFQHKHIDAAEFGNQLIKIFAKENF